MIKENLKSALIFVLYKISSAVLKKYKPKIIAITGTVGKTSTKDAIYVALSKFESTRKSPKSFNSEFGIPLTIIDAKNPGSDPLGWLKVLVEGLALLVLPNHYPKWLVLEVGTDGPGDIEKITEWLTPDIVVVTRLSKIPVHIEAFGSREKLFEEKGNLVKALKSDGTLVLNFLDEEVMKYEDLFAGKVVTFERTGDYEIIYDESKLPTGIRFNGIVLNDTVGEQHVEHIEAALSVIKALGFDEETARKVLGEMTPAPGRTRLIKGLGDSVILDDTYNSSPIAVEEALKTLKSIKLSHHGARRIAVLGDMLELGQFTTEAHKEEGRMAARLSNILITVGVRSKYTAGAAIEAGMKRENVFELSDSREAGKFLKDSIKRGDIILVKGSQGMRMERAVEELMSEPELKEKLLVRQDEFWKNK